MNTKTNLVLKDEFPESINDIRDKYFEGIPLSSAESTALVNYDKYRVAYLNASKDEDDFEKRYLELQAKANLHAYTFFIEESNLII